MFFFYVFYVQQKTEQPFDLSAQTRILNMEMKTEGRYHVFVRQGREPSPAFFYNMENPSQQT